MQIINLNVAMNDKKSRICIVSRICEITVNTGFMYIMHDNNIFMRKPKKK